ncbi:hypothetical protein C2857_005505 [Epichloe festucae Fl1]|uniref:Homeobox domain-containing protein n=1 Tax=Epichloe festucae (strain Fl1) TaxID=877507 RepID=A0A7S9KPM1_EPIFF|nr:hypothetical protein C2857_005505 [Epichloe festucae Fl1]
MLITRLCDTTDHSHWAAFYNHSRPPLRPSSSRMSDKQTLPPPSVEPDRQAQYSYLSSTEIGTSRSFTDTRDHGEHRDAGLTPPQTGPHAPQSRLFNPRALKSKGSHQNATSDIIMMGYSPRRNKDSPSIFSASSAAPKEHFHRQDLSSRTEQLSFSKSSESGSVYFGSSAVQTSATEFISCEKDDQDQSLSHGVDYEIEDENGDGDDGEGDWQSHGQTVAEERLAARRKMKRFRLTHQQTRFLMSEFAKQPHPDAAHRERLSREIPGLSPRQVQVWFQNRRAKIKRLTADDRDRMIRMRAVPDDFDNVQALHSPYGAVRGVTTMLSPSDLSSMGSHHGARPLMLDMRRGGGDSYLSRTGLTPSFGGIELGQLGPMGGSDMAPSASLISQDRLATGGSSPSPSGPSGLEFRSCGPYWNSGSSSMDRSAQSNRTGLRNSQAMHGRDWNPRSAPDALHTPLGVYQGDIPGSSSSDRQLDYASSQFVPPAPSDFSGMEPQIYPGNAQMTGKSSDNTTTMEGPDQSSVRSPHAIVSGPRVMDSGFKDSSRNAGLSSPHSHVQDRGHALPPLRSNMFSSPANHPRGPVSAPLDMPAGRAFSNSG